MRALRLRALVAVSVLTLIQCGDVTRQPAAEPSAPASSPGDRSPAASALPSASALPTATAGNVYIETLSGLAPSVAGIPPRVYVPNEKSNSVSVIDPVTLTVVGRIKVGAYPQHVTPSWDLNKLYVNDGALTEIDARTGAVIRSIGVPSPYNLYFTVDGSKAIVVAENLRRLDFYDPSSWKLLRSLPIPWSGINHMDASADGSYLLATCEFSGRVVKIDATAMTIISDLDIGGLPIDVKLSPDGSVFYVTNQGRGGVSIIDPVAMHEVGFLQTGRGAHGLALSRDTRSLYVSNRLAGTISVIDLAERRVAANWVIGGSPDMLTLSADGTQLWTGNRYGSSVTVIDTQTGTVVKTIAVESAPHGLTYFPQPGRLSLGHNGVYR
ncbi:MAG: YncE family protein [Gemmatimonadota bacterium]|nr:YncE family protein [Gemmatimonadota bacterium]